MMDTIRTCDDVQRPCINIGVRLHGPSNQVHLIDVLPVESCALHGDAAIRDLKSAQRPMFVEQWRAGREDRARRVDEATAIDDDAGTVRHDDFGTVSRDFQIASQLARRCTVDLIQDDPGRLAGTKVRIAVDHSGLLRLRHDR
nr:hypothetical protein [Pandoraea captiosa]